MENRRDWVSLSLPAPRDLWRYLLWGSGRFLISLSLFALYGLEVSFNAAGQVTRMCKNFTLNLLKIYDQLPYMGTVITQTLEPVAAIDATQPGEIITDLVAAIEGKQVMIIGGTGAGKSTVAQYLAYAVGGGVKVLDCEGTPEDWQGLQVVGRGEDWWEINATMEAELEGLSSRIKIRYEQGDKALVGLDEITIVEEYPEIRQKCPIADEWFERHARRGRKARRFIICLSQFDRVAAWGLEGKADLADCFYKLRLGKIAVNHAKSLKKDTLVQWLYQNQSHALLDDFPVKLPSYREMKSLPMAYTRTMVQPNTNNAIAPEKGSEKALKSSQEADYSDSFSDDGRLLWKLIQKFGEDKSDSYVITEVMGYTGKRYAEGKQILEELRGKYGNK